MVNQATCNDWGLGYTVLTWGDPQTGGDSSAVRGSLLGNVLILAQQSMGRVFLRKVECQKKRGLHPGWSMSINGHDVSWLSMIEEAYNHIQLYAIYPWPMLLYMHDLHSVKRTISAPSCCFLPAAWQILQALRGLDISTVSFYVAPNYWWSRKRNPAGCIPTDLKCPISYPAVFLTWWWPNIMNLPLTYPFAMWHER